MILEDNASERIKRFRRRYLDEIPFVSIERAKYYTEKWQETEESNVPVGIRVALAMKHVYENMGIDLDPDDRIAGTWTENFLGIPVDIERGLFNGVFEIEFDKKKMRKFVSKGNKQLMTFLENKNISPMELLEHTKKIGAAMPSLGTDTMDARKINPYKIKDKDKQILLEELIPYWKGKTIADLLDKEFKKNEIYPGEFGSFIESLPRTTSRSDMVTSLGSALGVWQGHLILDHETPIKKGLLKMLDKVQEMIENKDYKNQKELDFLKSIEISLEGVIVFSRRLVEKIEEELNRTLEPEKKRILSQMLEICQKVPFYPAETFREAIQSYWTVKIAVELAVPFNVHAPGRLDYMLYPYYANDFKEGRITREEACELFEELFLKIMSHNMRPNSNASSEFSQRYEGSEPVTMGGLTVTGEDATNELTYIMLDAADRSKASLNFAVRIHKNTPEKLWMKIADLHYHGVSSVSLMNDEICLQSLKNRGFSKEDALDYAITGCVDMCAPGKTGGEGFSSILLCRTLDMVFRNGDAMTLIGLVKDVGVETGDLDSFKSFEEFLDAFLVQADNMIKKIVDASTIRDSLYAKYLPAPLISAFMQGCLENKKDISEGGAIYDCEGILFMTSIANTIDSLYVVKKLVFEQKIFTLRELLDAVDNNFSNGYEWIHKSIMNLEGKWGNGNPESDELAQKITKHMFEETYKYRTFKDGFYAPFINSMTTHTYDGRISIATPDGRFAATPFAASCNPYNVEEHGPTGVLRSVTALPYEHVMGCAVNIRMHPSGIGKSEEGKKKWISLIKTYFQLGGEQLQPTVVSTKVLKAAQEDPENYRNIIVKVGGYSAYFTDLGKEIQDEIISRTEHDRV
ncbi:MAG: pyruvate formate lyase family protein [Candidatus Hermodarchaeota archaeon]